MEEQMKISAELVRKLRNARGWSQDQLAIAAGLSLRTIQRIEAEGVASMATRVSLAATFGIALAELVDEPAATPVPTPLPAPRAGDFARLLSGLAVLCCALLSESVRQVFPAHSAVGEGVVLQVALAIELLVSAVGAWLLLPAAFQLLHRRRIASVVLAMLGTPLAILMLGGLLVAVLGSRAPQWSLLSLGTGGVLLVGMGWRDAAQAARA
jgi:transcriptional regulator with XRE-family HTH domain